MLATLVPLSLATALMATNQTVLVLEDERIEVIFLDEAPKAAPGPPIAAPPGPKVQPETRPPPEREPEPEPVEPDDVRDDVPADQPPIDDGAVVAQLDLPPGGGGGGGCEGIDCDVDALCVGEHCSPDGPIGVREVHWSAVTVRRQVEPHMPAAARSLGPMSVKCTIRMSIDERGRVTAVLPVDCPPLFHDSAEQAAAKWRFDPMEVDGAAVPASFLLTIRYEVN